MKKTKRQNKSEPAPAKPRHWWQLWWVWAVILGALFAVYQIYEPALNGGFVFDDRYLPFFDPNVSGKFWTFVGNLRPLLMISFWIDYHRAGGADPHAFHSTNILLHFCTSILISLIVLRIVEWANVQGRMRVALALFSGGLFLLHPLQTESVAYVASRSEVLSALFYFAAFALFVWRPDSMTRGRELIRVLAILLLFVAAAGTKEDTLTLPVLMVLTDLYWHRGLRRNSILYATLGVTAIAGAVYVLRILRSSNSAGFRFGGVTPLNYFFTESRVLWTYLRLIILPAGQNVDPDVAISHGAFDHGAIVFLLALVALAVAAWMYRQRAPLAAFGFFAFLLLIAPTSSIVPIKDVLAEHRLYIPFLGLTLIACDLLRRSAFPQAVTIAGIALIVCSAVTYQRAEVWSGPLALWRDTIEKSPDKYRPRFQLAYANFEQNHCAEAVKDYQIASKLAPVDDELLVDWALALDCDNQHNAALDKLHQAAAMNNTPHVHTQIAVVYAKRQRYEQARAELMQALQLDPINNLAISYLGSVEEAEHRCPEARADYQRALQLNPNNQLASAGLQRPCQ